MSVAVAQRGQASIDRLSFEKIFYHRPHLDRLLAGDDDYPVHVNIGPTNFCNHDCTFCYARRSMFDSMGAPRARIDVQRLLEIIAEMRDLGLKSATLVGSGEPTLHPEIDEIISGIKRRGVEVGMYTNGSCMTDRTIEAIVNNATFVRFSVTGASREIHDLVHANGDYERVLANIGRVTAARRGRWPTVGIQFVLASYSAKDAVEGARQAKALGVDYFEIKPVFPSVGKLDQMINSLPPAEAEALMAQAKPYEDEHFQVHAKVEQMRGAFADVDDRPYDACPGCVTSTTLESDLKLYICDNQTVPEHCFGDLTRESFGEVWHGERRRRVLAELDVHKCPPKCRMDPLNRIVHSIQTGERVVPLNLPTPPREMHPNFL